MFTKNIDGVLTLFIFQREIEDIRYIILDRIRYRLGSYAPKPYVHYDAARAVYFVPILDREKDRWIFLLKRAKETFAQTPEEVQVGYSEGLKRWRLTMPFRYYEPSIDRLIIALEGGDNDKSKDWKIMQNNIKLAEVKL